MSSSDWCWTICLTVICVSIVVCKYIGYLTAKAGIETTIVTEVEEETEER